MNDSATAVPYPSRVRGCLLGGAVGDALGNPVEFTSLAEIRARFGPAGLTGMVETEITDDTQMTLFTAEGLIRARLHGGDPLTAVHDAYLRWLDTQDHTAPRPEDDGFRTGWLRTERWLYARRAPGNACLSGLRSGIAPPPPETPLAHGPVNPGSKGCGTVMRSAPFGLVRGPQEQPSTGDRAAAADPVALAAAAARITHGHPTAAVASGALAHLVGRLVAGDPLPEAVESTDRMLAALDGHGPEHRETREALRAARRLAEAGGPAPEKVETLGGAWIAEEALAIAVYCALAEPDPRRALLLSVNHSGDADSTGAVCGNIVGAAYGEAALPADWAAIVEGRDTVLRIADDLAAAFTAPVRGAAASAGPARDLAARYPADRPSRQR
ncbi:ADP-ribosylglycohydrolase family protein [Planomonospora sp. ID82291]|uniref:ADP-ribosylglycohydrolase family protein n=1 Tax=Planomonospora sp. ID82291 TaxID=2738136 RepID=UPI0018C3B35A|nr:ADP-ribosylglycohydrolase family protein [Planomonospora sp. ID82291]MBG0816958.1 ADP-ribosylglycohydrolase family protein [Planomonospora sp. ID82291]